MAERVVGLDVGTRAVRVADVEPGPRPVLRAFGQVDLPPGAVRDGEVVDIPVVADAIRRLWKQTGLRGRMVRVGLASSRVVVRTIDIPAVPDDELAGALQFQAQDYVTIPLDEAVLDFHVLERVDNDDGEPIARILLAAAHRETVNPLLEAVGAAGITVTGIDLLPLALIRGLHPEAGEPGSAEAIVSVGANITTVVVHEAGLPKVVRIVAAGGDAVTEAVAQELDVSFEEAEARKREVDGDVDPTARAAVDAGVSGITRPIHGSLDYYLNQHDAAPLTGVLLTGAGSLTPGLAEGLAASLGLPVEQARPRDAIDVGDLGISEDELAALDPYLPVAVGLALGARRGDGAQIDLLPPEARRAAAGRVRNRRLGVAAAVVLLVMVAASLFQVVGSARERDRLAAQRRVNATLQAQIAKLSAPLQDEADLAVATKGVTVALAGDISWTRVLEDLAGTVPEGVWLTTFSLQPAAPARTSATAAGPAGAAATIGSASFGATGLGYPAVASWLDRLPRLPYYLNLSVSSATKEGTGPVPMVTFSSSASVGPAARSDRLQRIMAAQP